MSQEFCCRPILDQVISPDEAEMLARRLTVLAEPARLRIISLVRQAGEMCGCDLEEPLGLSQPTVSHHLKVLVEGGFLERERRGKWAWYRVTPAATAEVAAALEPSSVRA
ncbi:MAG: metalloregulator ArsR/SmtB family transcription factor [Acidimicrobiia bacterium]